MHTIEELRKLETAQLSEALKKAKKDLFKIDFEVVNGQAKNNHDIQRNRKYVARIKTVINAKQNLS